VVRRLERQLALIGSNGTANRVNHLFLLFTTGRSTIGGFPGRGDFLFRFIGDGEFAGGAEAAQQLRLSVGTIKLHVHHILLKAGKQSRHQLTQVKQEPLPE
jgi:hypothetical protein